MQRLKVWLLAGREGIDKVVGLFRLRPGVSRLRGLDQDCGICRIIRAAVGNAVAGDLLALGRAIGGIQNVIGRALPARRVNAALGRHHILD